MHRSSMYSFQGQPTIPAANTNFPINQTPQWNATTSVGYGSATLQPAPTPANYAQPQPPAPTAQQLATAGALENYKRKVRQLEEEILKLRTNRAATPTQSKVSADEATIEALKKDVGVARKAQRKAEQRAELAELELASREEKAEFVDATQPVRAMSQPQASPSKGAFSMSRCAPSLPKRRRSNPPAESQPPTPKPVPTRFKTRPKRDEVREEVADEADWAVPNAAWLEEYDSSSRKAERVRAAVFTDSRTEALVALSARNPRLKKVMSTALAHSSDSLWNELQNALTTARGGSHIVLDTLRALQLNSDTYRGESAELAAAALKRDGETDEASYSLLATVDGGAIVAKDHGLARIIHDAVLNGSSGAVAVTAATSRVSAGEVVERLALAALDGARLAEPRYTLDTLAIAERNPISALSAEMLLALLEDSCVGSRVARLVTDIGAVGVDRAVLVRAMLALMDKSADVNVARSGVWQCARLKLVAAWVDQLEP